MEGPLVGVDDLIGATYFALCDDSIRGLFDATLSRDRAAAALPSPVSRWVDELRVVKHLSPEVPSAQSIVSAGFTPLNPTLAETVLAEIGWPG